MASASVFDYVEVDGNLVRLYTQDGQAFEVSCRTAGVAGRVGSAIRQTLPTWDVTFHSAGRVDAAHGPGRSAS